MALSVRQPQFPVCLLLLVLFCGAARGEDWPQWRGKRQNGTWRPTGKIASQWAKSGPPVIWSKPIGAAYSGISVANGRVYTMDRQGTQERVICLNAATGQEEWIHRYEVKYGKLTYAKGPRSTPTIHDGKVYTFGSVGHLRCLQAVDGKLVWQKDLVGKHKAKQPMWGFAASPVIHRDFVIVHAALPNGCYVAFNRHDGREMWRAGTDHVGYCTPLIFQHQAGFAMVGWTPQHILALSPASGRILWQVPYKVTYGVSIASPIVQNNLVLVCGYWEGSKAIQIQADGTAGKLLWEENRFLRGLMSQPLYRGRYGYLLEKFHGLVCFELQTGKKVWTDKNKLTPRGRNPQVTLVWVGKTDRAMCLNSNGELVQIRLTPQKYQELSRAKIVGQTWAHPAYAGTHVFARDDKRIVCVDLSSAQKK